MTTELLWSRAIKVPIQAKNLPSCCLIIGVVGLLTATIAVPIKAQEEDPAFALLEIEVVDAAGKPLAEVAIDVEMDGLDFPIQADKQGFASLNLSTGSSLDLKFALEGYVPQHVHWSRGSNIPDELKVELQAGLPLGGVVHDEQGQPIEGVEIIAKTLTRGFRGGQLQPNIEGVIAETDKQGRWEARVGTKQPIDLQIRIAHADYISLSLGNVDQKTYQAMRTLKLATTLPKRLAPTGMVVDAQGQAVVGVEIFVALAGRQIQLVNGKIVNFVDGDTLESVTLDPSTVTDAEGKFTLPIQKPGFFIVCIDDRGWAKFSGSKWDANRPVEIKLTLWATLEGSVQLGGKAAAEEEVAMYFLADFQRERLDLEWRYLNRTNAEGEFSFDRVAPGVITVVRRVNGGDGSFDNRLASHGNVASIAAGKQVRIKLGGDGRTVVGKCVLQDAGKPVPRIYGEVTLMKNNVAGWALKKAFFRWGQAISAAGTWPPQAVYEFRGPSRVGIYATGLEADGSFRLEDVPPGQYRMETVFFGPPKKRRPGKRLGVIVGNHLVPKAKEGEAGPFDLGERSLDVSRTVPVLQEVPAGAVK